MPLKKAICPVCGTEFQKHSPIHKYCSSECYKIASKALDRLLYLRRLRNNKGMEYDWILDMESGEWKENANT